MISCKTSRNTEKNGIEIRFSGKPSEEIRTRLKDSGFRWSRFSKVWYIPYSQDNWDTALQICPPGTEGLEGIETTCPANKCGHSKASLPLAQHLAAWEAVDPGQIGEKGVFSIESFIDGKGIIYVRYLSKDRWHDEGADPIESWVRIGKGGKLDSYFPNSERRPEYFDFGNGLFGVIAKDGGGEWYRPADKDGYPKIYSNGKQTRAAVKKLEELGFETKGGKYGLQNFKVRFKDKAMPLAKKVGEPEMKPFDVPSVVFVPKNKRKPHYKLPAISDYKDRAKLNSNVLKQELLLGKLEVARYQVFDGYSDGYDYITSDKLTWSIPDGMPRFIFLGDSPWHDGENLITWGNYKLRYHNRSIKSKINLAGGSEEYAKGKGKPSKPSEMTDGEQKARADKWRSMAETLERNAEKKENTGLKNMNWTPRRARMIASAQEDADRFRRQAKTMRAFADALENNGLPGVLMGVKTKGDFETLLWMKSIAGAKADQYGRQYSEDEKQRFAERVRKYANSKDGIDGIDGNNVMEAIEALKNLGSFGLSEDEKTKRKIQELENKERRDKSGDFFNTPRSLVLQMIKAADIEPGMTVLEPSAGIGHIAEVVREKHPDARIEVAEKFSSRHELLELKGFQIIGSNALEIDGQYDRILMNPPFSKGQDIDHVRHAYEHNLRPGGRLVAIMGEGSFTRSFKKEKEFQDWVSENAELIEQIPEGTFSGPEAFNPTNVRARMVVMEKETDIKEDEKSVNEVAVVKPESITENIKHGQYRRLDFAQLGEYRIENNLLFYVQEKDLERFLKFIANEVNQGGGGYVSQAFDRLGVKRPVVSTYDWEEKKEALGLVFRQMKKDFTSLLERLGSLEKYNSGLPQVLGKEITIVLPNKETRKAQYAIVEADFLTASHNERTFASSPGYPLTESGHNINDRNYSLDKNAQALVETYARELRPELLIDTSKTPSGSPIIGKDGTVVSGNNRTMSIKRAIKDYPDRYKAYLQQLRNEWFSFSFPFSDDELEKFEHPIFVRILHEIPAYTTQELAKYNQSETKGKRPVDKAIELSQILRENNGCSLGIPRILEKYERMGDFYSNGSDQAIMMKMLKDCNLLTEQEISSYYDKSTGFTNTGKDFLEATLSAAILGRDAILASDKAGVRKLRRVIVTTLPTLSQNKGLGAGSLTRQINEAVLYQLEIVSSGLQFSDYINQASLFENRQYSDEAIYLNRLMNVGRNAFKKAIEGYNSSVAASAGATMFGEAPKPEEAFSHYIISAVPAKEKTLIEGRGGKAPSEPIPTQKPSSKTSLIKGAKALRTAAKYSKGEKKKSLLSAASAMEVTAKYLTE